MNKIDNEFYHCEEKGCDLEPKIKKRFTQGRIYKINGQFCKTHNVFVCKCGWRLGFHYGTDSKLL